MKIHFLRLSLLLAAVLVGGTANALQLALKQVPSEKCEGLVLVQLELRDVVKTVESFGVDLEYDPTVLSYDGVVPGKLLQGWLAADGREQKPGAVRLGGIRGDGQPISPGIAETDLITIAFKWICDKPECKSALKVVKLHGNIEAAQHEPTELTCGAGDETLPDAAEEVVVSEG